MTYPQPNPSDQIAKGAAQWRFVTQLGTQKSDGYQSAGAGEIYEIDASFSALSFGPDMDFAQLQLTYFDPTTTSGINTVRLTPHSGFPGQLVPRPDQVYPLTPNRHGRMLVSLIDMWNGTYTPVGFGGSDQIYFVKPTIDLIGWQSAPPGLTTTRSDKAFRYESFSSNNASTYWVIVPYYGRQYGYVGFRNESGASVSIEVRGVNLSTVNTTSIPTTALHQESQILVATPTANHAQTVKVTKGSTDGQFDLLAIGMLHTAALNNASLRIIVSDTE